MTRSLDRPIAREAGFHVDHPEPVARFFALAREHDRTLLVLLSYTFLTGLLSLAVPLAAQALVNTIAAGMFIQPLVILTLLLFGGLLITGFLRVLKLALVETIQQQTFAEVALKLGRRIPRIEHVVLSEEYMPELVNRFFDVINIQKSWAKLLLDVPSAFLQVLIGLILMAFYSPILLVFDLVIVFCLIVIIFGLGRGGIDTSISESREKYRVAEWLEELARCETSFKMCSIPVYLMKKTDLLVVQYIQARRSHFAVILRQSIGSYLFQAFANAGILGIGGFLVIERQLTLGQLVAAEIIVVVVLSSVDKLIRSIETYFDLVTGLHKVGHVIDLPTERHQGLDVKWPDHGTSVTVKGLHFSYADDVDIFNDLDLSVKPEERMALVGKSGSGKSTLAALICRLQSPSHGSIQLDKVDVSDISLKNLRKHVALVSDANEIFEGTIEENITIGRDFVSYTDVVWALSVTQLDRDMVKFKDGLKTELVSSGRNLSRGQMQRILIARAIVERPQVLILDEAFTGIDEHRKLEIMRAIYDRSNPWTVINISHDIQTILECDSVSVLDAGRIIEIGDPEVLIDEENSAFASLFSHHIEWKKLGRKPIQ